MVIKHLKAITDVLQLGTGGVLGLGGSKESRMAVKLANEKVECPYLLIGKKMYAAVKWTPSKGHEFSSELEYKGIDAVRRDRTKIVRELSEAVLTNLLVHNDIKNALKLLQDGLNSIVDNKVPLEDYILSKSLKGSYASENLPHVQAYKRMQQRGDPGLPPLGSRMPMLFVTPKNPKNVKLYEIAEHPEYVRQKKLRPWAYYYINNIRNVMERLFEPTQIKVSKYFDDAEARANHITSRNRSLLDMLPQAKKQKVEE
jgi:DNA polymerase elongation subunit (family B)